ncbi:ATP-grasp domain-containing protein [Spongiactinospora sp. TRM90649]|uniref:ATP-grasp domain-containing protein n=1 Tax=Spongiactinospora sp. TRM90649 TaxID=3031114 RepID=UPI0023F95AB0|nr:ATP-grasp domain-containing protein [Spongiactinospora sp. TRM90649]MDF5756212.1 ATP-grasp domain-containing protein [Spongiactinospora sp. TRM90649]
MNRQAVTQSAVNQRLTEGAAAEAFRREPSHEQVHHVVASRSVAPWLEYFCSAPVERIHHAGEHVSARVLLEDRLLPLAPRLVVFHSNHYSLPRDIELATTLRGLGIPALAQSGRCARLGLDKLALRDFLARRGVPMPELRSPGKPARPGERWVIKHRAGTAGLHNRMADDGRHAQPAAADEYVERFVDGEEYSVIAYADATRVVTFPLIQKGRARFDLLPPHMRGRICPAVGVDPALEARMMEITRLIATDSRCSTWLEVEFIVPDDGEPLVLEINPRVSGTLRIGAMVTGLRAFDLPTSPAVRGHLPSLTSAVEAPWFGAAVLDPDRQVFATSRITVCGADRAELEGKLAEAGLSLSDVLAEAGIAI